MLNVTLRPLGSARFNIAALVPVDDAPRAIPACKLLTQPSTREQCAEWFASRRFASCLHCPTGEGITSQAQEPMRQSCVRCGATGQRLLSHSLCVSCFNRQREVLAGRNAKGKLPMLAGSKLRQAHALVRTPRPAGPMLSSLRDQSLRITGTRPGLPTLEYLDRFTVFVSATVTGLDELQVILSRLLPGSIITDFDIGMTFTQQWELQAAVVTPT